MGFIRSPPTLAVSEVAHSFPQGFVHTVDIKMNMYIKLI
jgi:hypothetical protein